MNSAFRFDVVLRRLSLLLLVLSGAAFFLFWRAWTRLDDLQQGQGARPGGTVPAISNAAPARVALTGAVWSAVQAMPEGGSAGSEGSGVPFRLAGTFFMQIGDQGVIRKAILDEIGTTRQHVVAEGDHVGSAEVRRIDADRVALWLDNRLVEIRLEFRGGASTASGVSSGMVAAAAGSSGGVLETNRFGAKVQENRWLVDRKPVLEYYQELLDEPERMVGLYDSMKPMYDDRRRITGYVLGVEGEADFFRAVGLAEGDIVRRVNSVPVTSKRWADHFIKEFVEDRLNVVVLDVERDGKPDRLIYQVRQ